MLGRIGALLLVAGGVVSLVVVVIALTGGAYGVVNRSDPMPSMGEVLTAVALAVLGLGALVVTFAGTGAFDLRGTRLGVAVIGVGSLGLASGSMLPFLGSTVEFGLTVLLVGLAASALGLLATAVALIRLRGWLRLAGLAMLAGLVGALLMPTDRASVIAEGLFLLFALGFATVGVMILRAEPHQDLP